MRHFLRDTDITSEEQRQILTVARMIKKRSTHGSAQTSARRSTHYTPPLLAGSAIGLLFEKPSLRTRVSSETACALLGAHPVLLRAEELHFHRGETPADGAAVLGGYLSLVLARVYSQTFLEQLASAEALPIVNGLSDIYHPLQALADLLTLLETHNGRLAGLTLAYLGDGNNVAHSLLLAGALAGLHVRVATPEKYAPHQSIVEEAKAIADSQNGSVHVGHDGMEAVSGADAVYTDVWTSMGQEGEEGARTEAFRPYQLSMKVLSAAKPNAIALHCLPAHFGEEITREVYQHRQSRILRQAHNRLPATAALFLFLLSKEAFLALAAEA